MSDSYRPTSWSLHDEVYPYALDAVDETRRREIENRLASADPVMAEDFHLAVGRVHDTLAAMTLIDATAPPSRLEAALLRALDQRFPAPNELAARRSRRYRWIAAAAAAVAVAVGVGIGIGVDRAGQEPGAITAQQVIEAPGSREGSTTIEGGGEMTVHSSADLGAAAVSLRGLPTLSADQAYQLWVIPPDGDPRSVQVMSGDGTVVALASSADTLAVTVEPAGGSPGPTTSPITSMLLG
ncbi:anti-sigma factor domain-containing protein [Nocardia sp. NPDC058176]|uniref:anti-sigma factor n=1 Tax=Nocardia sp. NPDC058176 TaxID=3346368 RepID=UPI0036DF897E